ncbi:MAG: serine acetyltransferase [Lentisphaerae bacterium]|nr:serine acetyltransferase [Lentisphaerota bacterium]
MNLNEWFDGSLPGIVGDLARSTRCSLVSNTRNRFNLAGQKAIHGVVDDFLALLFPGCHGSEAVREDKMEMGFNIRLRSIAQTLTEQVEFAFKYQCEFEKCKECGDCREKAEAAVIHLVGEMPAIKRVLEEDIQAAYDGDPAAKSLMEIVMSYPGLHAIAVQRIAHLLYEKDVALIPRVMSELAHSRTGIDIHPGAKIGPGFFIDHGTGVVIGETCVIGRNVKLYQGVTLGALSFPKDENGNPIKGIKRHPEVRDGVTIYAGATILGGDTVVGEGSVIGGNVWLTHSVPPHSTVYNAQPKPNIRLHGGQADAGAGEKHAP